MLRALLPTLLLTFFSINASAAGAASASQKIEFDYTQSGTPYQLARVALRDLLLPLEEQIQRKTILFTAREDLNGDDVPEIIVKLADKKFFCDDTKGGCKIFILAVSDQGPQKIGEFYGEDVFISDETINRAKTLSISTIASRDRATFIWQNGRYTAINESEGS